MPQYLSQTVLNLVSSKIHIVYCVYVGALSRAPAKFVVGQTNRACNAIDYLG